MTPPAVLPRLVLGISIAGLVLSLSLNRVGLVRAGARHISRSPTFGAAFLALAATKPAK